MHEHRAYKFPLLVCPSEAGSLENRARGKGICANGLSRDAIPGDRSEDKGDRGGKEEEQMWGNKEIWLFGFVEPFFREAE